MRYLTAGESHGKALVSVVEGCPAGLSLSAEDINAILARRQRGYGRGGRMQIERDTAQIISGVRFGETLGGPIALLIENRDWANWSTAMATEGAPPQGYEPVTRPRPGHADLVGALKYGRRDLRDVLERASARETAARVAAGAVARELLRQIDVTIFSHVTAIGGVEAHTTDVDYDRIALTAETSDVRCADDAAAEAMRRAIDDAREAGDTVGGVFEVVCLGLPPGLGSYVQADRRLDGRLASALMSIQAIKGVEIGLGFGAAARRGSRVHDAITLAGERYWRAGNNAGGLEGGVTTGLPLVAKAAMKPISTLTSPLPSVDMQSHQAEEAAVERSDVCAVPAAAIVGEAAVAWVVADAVLEKFGCDSLAEVRRNLAAYLADVAER